MDAPPRNRLAFTGSLQQASAPISFYRVPLGVNGPTAPQPLVRIGDARELEIPEAFLGGP